MMKEILTMKITNVLPHFFKTTEGRRKEIDEELARLKNPSKVSMKYTRMTPEQIERKIAKLEQERDHLS
jgi:hypothetical protein